MRRIIWVPVLALALAVLGGLIVSALKPIPVRAYALGAGYDAQVAALPRGREACEGPIRVSAAVGEARVWGVGLGGPAWIEVIVRDAMTGKSFAHGWAVVPGAPASLPAVSDASLEGSIPPGSTINVCVVGQGPALVSLRGSPPAIQYTTSPLLVAHAHRPEIVMRLAGKPTRTEFSLVLFDRSRHSLLAALPTAFSRAALFRFSWTGPWTFWVLAAAFLGTIATCGWAVAAAARADTQVDGARPEAQMAATPTTRPSERTAATSSLSGTDP